LSSGTAQQHKPYEDSFTFRKSDSLLSEGCFDSQSKDSLNKWSHKLLEAARNVTADEPDGGLSANDEGYDAEDEGQSWHYHDEDSSLSSEAEADDGNAWSAYVRSSVLSMGDFFATLDPFAEKESLPTVAKGILSACASAEACMDWEAVRDALIPAMASAIAPPDGIGVQIMMEIQETAGHVDGFLLERYDEKAAESGTQDQIDLSFEVFASDAKEVEPARTALLVEAKCGGACRLLPYLVDNLTCISKPVPRYLRIFLDTDLFFDDHLVKKELAT
jgi:hypothetical protein